MSERESRTLVVPALGAVVATGDPLLPWQVVDAAGVVREPVVQFVRELVASDYSPATCRSHCLALLRWFRFLDALGVAWDAAQPIDVRDHVLWLRWTRSARSAWPIGRREPREPQHTGWPTATGYRPKTINHALSTVSAF